MKIITKMWFFVMITVIKLINIAQKLVMMN